MFRRPSTTKFKYSFVKYKRLTQKNTMKGIRHGNALLTFKTTKRFLLSLRLLEVIRRTLNKPVRESFGKLHIRNSVNLPVSKKPLQARMGKGKGKPYSFVQPVYENSVLFSIHRYLDELKIRSAIKRIKKRLPIELREKHYLGTGWVYNELSGSLTLRQHR